MAFITNRNLFFLSTAIVLYFLFLYFNASMLHLDFIWMGVMQELLTLPLLMFQVFLFVLAFRQTWNEKFSLDNYAFWALLLLTVCCFFTIFSFFYR